MQINTSGSDLAARLLALADGGEGIRFSLPLPDGEATLRLLAFDPADYQLSRALTLARLESVALAAGIAGPTSPDEREALADRLERQLIVRVDPESGREVLDHALRESRAAAIAESRREALTCATKARAFALEQSSREAVLDYLPRVLADESGAPVFAGGEVGRVTFRRILAARADFAEAVRTALDRYFAEGLDAAKN